MKPFYQGKLDVFCAIYAVLNGLRLTHNIHTLKGRDILNETLYNLALDPQKFKDVLNQNTDYVFLVDALLDNLSKKFLLETVKPFTIENKPTIDSFWNTCDLWLNNGKVKYDNRAILCRFCRYMKDKNIPLIKHWTTIQALNNDKLLLFDSSHESESIKNLKKENIALAINEVDPNKFIYIQADTIRMMRMPF